MRTIAIVNQKGGCGKTITSINLAAFLALAQKRTLLVDMDPQGHATLGVLADAVQPSRTLYDLFLREEGRPRLGIRDVCMPIRENLDLAPADILLSAIPERLRGLVGRENVLSEVLAEVRGSYDYVIVDCPPSVGLLTFNAVKACEEAIIPMDPSFFSLHGIGKVLETFEVLQQETGHHVRARVLVTLYAGRSPFVKAVLDEIRNNLPDRYFETVIRYSVKLAEAASHGLPIAHYSRQSAGFEDYQALTAEVLEQDAPGQEIPASVRQSAPSEWSAVPANGNGAAHGDADGHANGNSNGQQKHGVPAGPQLTPEGVVFTVEAPGAAHVQLVGDFNGWNLDGNEMEPNGSLWRKVVKLHPGRYQYRFVVDGRWQNDPMNLSGEPSPFGGSNSVLVLDGSSADNIWS